MKTLLVWARAICIAWMTLLALTYIVERPLLRWIVPWIGVNWIATAHLGFNCLAMAAAGFEAGRFNRVQAVQTASVFAISLCFWNFAGVISVNVPWMVRLIWNSLQDARYLDSLITSVETHVLLFGCLFAGAMLSRPREKPISIAG